MAKNKIGFSTAPDTTTNSAEISYFEEVGTTGLKRMGGNIREEWNQKLQGRRLIKTLREMADNEVSVFGFLYITEAYLRGVEGSYQAPHDPETNAPVAGSEEIATRLNDAMADMKQKRTDLMAEITRHMLRDGCAPIETTYKMCKGRTGNGATDSRFNDGFIGWRSLAIRPLETVQRWEFNEEGEVSAMVQMAEPDFKVRTIPAEKLLLIRARGTKNNPEGESVLRGAVRPYHFLKHTEEIEGIVIERDGAGLPVFEVPVSALGPNASAEQKAMVKSLRQDAAKIRTDSYMGLVVPASEDSQGKTGFGFRLQTSAGSRAVDTDKVIQRHRTSIQSALLTSFTQLGTNGAGGSRALGESGMDSYTLSLLSFLGSIAEYLTEAAARLCALNGIAEELWPSFVFGDVKAPKLTEIAAYLSQMVQSGVIRPGAELEKWAREQANLPAMPEGAEVRDLKPAADDSEDVDLTDLDQELPKAA